VVGLGIFSKYLEGTNRFEQVANGQRNGRGIVYDAVQELYEDREENIWVATKNHGLYRFNPGHDFFTNIGHIQRSTGDIGNGSVLSFIETNWGTLLVGTWGDGIYQYDRNLRLTPTSIRGLDPKGGPTIWSMTLSRDRNTVWMGGQPGVAKLDQVSRSLTHYVPPALQNKTVRQVAEDAEGNLWLGMQSSGLYRWDKMKGRVDFNAGIGKSHLVPQVTINKLLVDSEGLLWVGTSNQGLYVINPITQKLQYRFHHEGEEGFRLPEPGISSVLPYNDSLVIITTGTHITIFNRKTRQLKNFGSGEGLSGFIASMEKDTNGYVWLTTTSGLYRINIQKGIFVRFTRDEGIDNENFVLSASYRLPGGKLAFGSSNEFVIFDPAHMLSHQMKPNVYITSFNVMGRSLRLDSLHKLDIVRLGAKHNSVTVEFSPLRYAISYQVRYMLEGLDEDWQYADPRNNQAVYSYLPGGNYTLRIQAVNEEGQFGRETVLRLRITPPFWKSWWFLTGIVLLIAAILFFLDRERMKRKEALQKMRTDISNNLHGEVNTALNNINILSEMARLKSTRDPEKAEEYIEQIHTKSHNMIIVMDDMLWSLDPANDNMRKTVERMQEYIEALNNRHGAYIDMEVDKNVEQLKLNMKLRHDAFILFKEGIHNLVQAGVSICHIRLGLEKQQLVFTMEFDTETADMQQINNLFHRHDMEKRVENINAEMDVAVQKNSTIVVLKIPLY
jgi:signal transduction histidine kinase